MKNFNRGEYSNEVHTPNAKIKTKNILAQTYIYWRIARSSSKNDFNFCV